MTINQENIISFSLCNFILQIQMLNMGSTLTYFPLSLSGRTETMNLSKGKCVKGQEDKKNRFLKNMYLITCEQIE